MGLYALILLSIIGSWYLYHVTKGFSISQHLYPIWLLYIVTTYFKVRFLYYNAFLLGAGKIKYLQQTTIIYRISNIFISALLLLCNLGLISIVISDLISLIIQRYLAQKGFYTNDLKRKLSIANVSNNQIKDLYSTIWYNAKKIGLTSFASFLVSQIGLYFAGFYLSLESVASYGLMCQLVAVISTISTTLITINLPYFSSCIIKNRQDELLKRFSVLIILFYLFFIIGTILLLSIAPSILIWIHSKAFLPSVSILLVYSIIRLLEGNHGNFASILVSSNKVPYMKAALISGFFTLLGLIVVLKYTNWGLWGIVLVPGLVQGS